jgi:hypothetical protein
MSYTLQFKRYSTVTLGSITGATGELIVDSTKKTITIHDGATAGGTPLATENYVSAQLVSYSTLLNLTSTLTSYVTNANLTSTLTSYTTNANLTSTLASYTLNATLTSVLTYLTSTTIVATNITSNTLVVTNTSNATTVTSGALQVKGGLSVSKDIFLGSGAVINLNNILNISAGTISRGNGDFYLIGGGSQLTRNSLILSNSGGPILWGGSATNDSPATTGIYGIRLAGGDGNVNVINTSESTSISTGSFIVGGGVGITKRLNVGNLAAFSSGISVTYEPASTVGAAIAITGKGSVGGSGYMDFIKVTNTAAGTINSSKTLRISPLGALEVINDAYNSNLFVLDDTGNVTLAGALNMSNRPAFRVIGTGAVISSTTTLKNTYWTLDYQQGTGLNTSTGIFTAPYSGLYQVNVVVRTATNTNSSINQVIIWKTAGTSTTAQIMVEFGVNTTMNHAGGSTITRMTAGDTLRFDVAAGQISFDGNDNWSVAYIG